MSDIVWLWAKHDTFTLIIRPIRHCVFCLSECVYLPQPKTSVSDLCVFVNRHTDRRAPARTGRGLPALYEHQCAIIPHRFEKWSPSVISRNRELVSIACFKTITHRRVQLHYRVHDRAGWFVLCCVCESREEMKRKASGLMTRLTFSIGLMATLLLVIGHAESAKIVCVFPTASKSHVLGAQALLKELAHRGHEVTMVSAFPLKKPPKNYRDVYVPIENAFSSIMNDFMQGGSRNMMKLLPKILRAAQESSNVTINAPEFLRLAREEQFDLAIVGFFMNSFIIGVGELFRCPTVLYFSASGSGLTNVVGNPAEVAAVPHILLGPRNPMTFFDRVANTVLTGVEKIMMMYIRYTELPYYNSNFPAEKGFRSYDEAMRNVSLVLLNTHFSQTVPKPYIPNMVEVGGIQINVKPEPMAQDLQQFLDGAGRDGAIFISFGSNLKSSTLRQDKLDSILAMIRGLKQRVIWKWDQDEMPNKPTNVFIGKWLPQDAILAHPNLKLFITHGGLGSITESMYHGVPIVGIPMFGDQDGNVAQVVKEGWGLSVSFDELTEPLLSGAVQEVLRDPKYRDHIQGRSILYKDRPMGALETGVYWVEYVIRHHGAPHLHYQGADLNLLQLALLDVFAFLFAVFYVVFKIVVIVGRKVKNAVFGGSKSTQKTAKKQKKK
ncbi:UDP-glucosyltransferase 2-like [Anopheles stephensi]|uniref:UDP-glucosyltransferase 2-like n=1 Tax=Anopheles stephensi TaxID=30069 RepID=UPI0016589881|nr:UDP-glucosyltransferase 2-like [Anopheles stephensi]